MAHKDERSLGELMLSMQNYSEEEWDGLRRQLKTPSIVDKWSNYYNNSLEYKYHIVWEHIKKPAMEISGLNHLCKKDKVHRFHSLLPKSIRNYQQNRTNTPTKWILNAFEKFDEENIFLTEIIELMKKFSPEDWKKLKEAIKNKECLENYPEGSLEQYFHKSFEIVYGDIERGHYKWLYIHELLESRKVEVVKKAYYKAILKFDTTQNSQFKFWFLKKIEFTSNYLKNKAGNKTGTKQDIVRKTVMGIEQSIDPNDLKEEEEDTTSSDHKDPQLINLFRDMLPDSQPNDRVLFWALWLGRVDITQSYIPNSATPFYKREYLKKISEGECPIPQPLKLDNVLEKRKLFLSTTETA